MQTSSESRLAPEFLARLVCPVTHSPLRQEGDWLVATQGDRRYPIREGLPILLAEEARTAAEASASK